MKFNFKIQPFQPEAVDSVVRVFDGQAKHDPVSFRCNTKSIITRANPA